MGGGGWAWVEVAGRGFMRGLAKNGSACSWDQRYGPEAQSYGVHARMRGEIWVPRGWDHERLTKGTKLNFDLKVLTLRMDNADHLGWIERRGWIERMGWIERRG